MESGTNATTQSQQPSNQDVNSDNGWAPGWRQPAGGSPDAIQQPKSFDQAFSQQADAIAKDLGLDTAEQPKQKQKAPEPEVEDPQGDEELELAPGKKLTRKQLSKQLKEYEALQKKHAELERGSGQKFREAAEKSKRADAQMAEAQKALAIKARLEQVVSQNDPDKLLAEFGIDPDGYRQAAIEKAYADSQKSPEQREIDRLRAYEQELTRVKQDQQKQQLEQQKQVQAQQETEATNKLAGNLSQSMMATADKMGLPKSSLTIQRMANLLAAAQSRGIDPTWEQLGQAAHAQYIEDTSQLFERMTYDDFHAKIPQKTRDKIRQFFLQKAQGPSSTPAQAGSAPQPRPKAQKPMSAAEYNAYVNQLRQPRSA